MPGGFVGFVSAPPPHIDDVLEAEDWDDIDVAEWLARAEWADLPGDDLLTVDE